MAPLNTRIAVPGRSATQSHQPLCGDRSIFSVRVARQLGLQRRPLQLEALFHLSQHIYHFQINHGDKTIQDQRFRHRH